jgi:hypothetical protein
MNEEMLADSVLLVISLKWRLIGQSSWFHQLFCNCLANPSLQCTSAAKLFNNTGGPQIKNYDLNSAFEKAYRLPEQKSTGSQFHYVAPLTYSPTCVGIYCKKYVFFSITNQRSP